MLSFVPWVGISVRRFSRQIATWTEHRVVSYKSRVLGARPQGIEYRSASAEEPTRPRRVIESVHAPTFFVIRFMAAEHLEADASSKKVLPVADMCPPAFFTINQ